MLAFILTRLAQAVLVMVVVALLAFTMFRFVGDPINQMVGQDTSDAEREALRESLGLNDPVIVQFARYVGHAVQFDFGNSYQFKQPVSKLIGERAPATLELSVTSAVLALLIGVPMGVFTGLYPQRWISRVFLGASLIAS
jgi:peptide/nickel transport system permease protein